MPNFPGSQGALPSVYSEVVTLPQGISVPSGTRLAVILGEGARVETLVSSANGSGKDGLNPTYTSTNGSDGRHFQLSFAPVISNRTSLFKNGIPLVGTEEAVSGSSFDTRFDYRIDITNGQIELQGASLVDQGGQNYLANPLNTGDGTITSLELVDPNAPTETWTIRCASVRRDGYGNPVDGYAKFIAQGNISGIILDGYGNQITWQSNGIVVSNTILSFAINEGATPFVEGDKFTVKVRGGALVRGDSLVATYIAEADINDPEFFTDLNNLVTKHGNVSLSNRISLGAQLAFANNTPGVWTCQAAPSIPRRVSYLLRDSASGEANPDDLNFPLPLGVTPDTDGNIHFFVTDPVLGTETQIIPNKVDFYDPTFTASPNTFYFSPNFSYSYTVILDPTYEDIENAGDGVLTATSTTLAVLSSSTITFTAADADSTRRIRILTPDANAGVYPVVSVSGGKVTISSSTPVFVDSTDIEFEVLDISGTSARVLFTSDLALAAGQSLRATVVDVKDAPFFDVGWEAALQAIEKIEVDIVVPLPSQTISAIFATSRSHVETMSNVKNKKERMLFIGAIRGLTPDNVTGVEPAAVEDIGVLEGIQGDSVDEILAGNTEDLTDYGVQNSYGTSFRVVFFYPDEIVVQIGGENTKIDGFFLAAAAAGFLSGVPNIAIPLTNKNLAGFAILRDKLFRPIILEQIANSGITVLQPVLGGGNVIWGKTTTASGFVAEQEISIIFIRDRVAKSMRGAFKGFIGQAESPGFIGTLMAVATSVAQSFISSGLITTFKDLKVARDVVDPTQYNISLNISPIFPVNFIFIKIGIGVL